MTIKTVTVESLTEVNFNESGDNPYFYASEKFAFIRNKSGAVMYVSRSEDVGAGVLGSAEIASGEFVRLELDGTNVLYLSGSGDAEIYTTSTAECPFKRAGKGGENGDFAITVKEREGIYDDETAVIVSADEVEVI